MAVVKFDITDRSDFGSAAFGNAGRYQQLEGTVSFAVDPGNPANHGIVDLHLAPKNHRGLVEFSADFSLTTPQDMAKGNNRLVVDIPNRGNRLTAGHFHQVTVASPEDRSNPGDGFLCHRGFSFLSIGWQWDAQAEGGLCLQAPEALLEGQPIDGDVLMKLQPDRDRPHLTMMQLGQVRPSYPVHDPASSVHRLYECRGRARRLIDRQRWHFADNRHIHMSEGFRKGVVYELVYRTRGAPVVGTGLLAIRDIATCLRYQDSASPLKAGFSHVHGFGVSQTGRVLRHFLYEGLNRDEHNRIAYDGMLIHIAGGQRGDFNHRFAQPTVANIPGLGQRFPFAASNTTDPVSNRQDGLLNKLDSSSTPKVIFSNTSWEYWRGDASLIHIQNQQDLPEHPNTRIYHIAGTHHIGGILFNGRQTHELPTGLKTAMPLNVINAAPVFRALFTALDQWVVENKDPPASVHPKVNDGSASRRADVLHKFALQSDTPLPDNNTLPSLYHMDFGPLEAAGVASQPVSELVPYTAFVSDVNADLNEIAGIHLPDIACPLGYHTGWNPRSPDIGAADELATFAGFTVFFTREEILSRYSDEETWLALATSCIDDLIAARFILSQDRQWMINIARSRFRAAMNAGGQSATADISETLG